MVEVYRDYTSNLFLTVYVAIVNYQEIPIGGIKAVGTFEPGGLHHESPLSKWFFDARTAPGAVVKVGSVKFEPPGGIQAGTWFIHLENEQGVRLSEDVDLATDPNAAQWFYIKFKQPNPPGVASVPTSPGAVTRTVTPVFGTTPTTPPAATSGWSFANVQMVSDDSSGGVIFYGDMVNNTGATQQIDYLTGTFQDNQGRSFSGTDYTYDYWPIEIVPPGSKVPFELSVYDVANVVNYTLSVISQPAGETPRQDFEILNPSTFDDQGFYCVNGQLRNSGGSLASYLVVIAVLFNAQNQVINFDSYDEPYPEEISGSQTSGFEICIDPYEQSVARYELRAWGQ
jgi:hypothetical protein